MFPVVPYSLHKLHNALYYQENVIKVYVDTQGNDLIEYYSDVQTPVKQDPLPGIESAMFRVMHKPNNLLHIIIRMCVFWREIA